VELVTQLSFSPKQHNWRCGCGAGDEGVQAQVRAPRTGEKNATTTIMTSRKKLERNFCNRVTEALGSSDKGQGGKTTKARTMENGISGQKHEHGQQKGIHCIRTCICATGFYLEIGEIRLISSHQNADDHIGWHIASEVRIANSLRNEDDVVLLFLRDSIT